MFEFMLDLNKRAELFCCWLLATAIVNCVRLFGVRVDCCLLYKMRLKEMSSNHMHVFLFFILSEIYSNIPLVIATFLITAHTLVILFKKTIEACRSGNNQSYSIAKISRNTSAIVQTFQYC